MSIRHPHTGSRSAPLSVTVFRRHAVGLLAMAGCLTLVGCSSKAPGLAGLAPVAGTVTLKGAPLEGATVTFAATGAGRSAAGTTDAKGKFSLTSLNPGDGAMPGEYTVTVKKTETVGKVYNSQESQEYYMKNQKAPPAPQVKNLVNEKFALPSSSPLKATVKAGKNDFTFDVE